MDWDEISPKPKKKEATIGEDLAAFSIGELEERISILRAEIARTEAEVEKKQKQAGAASALFRS